MPHAIMIRDVTTGRFDSAAEFFSGTEGFEDDPVLFHETDVLETGVTQEQLSLMLWQEPDTDSFDTEDDHDPFYDPFEDFTARENARNDKYALMALGVRSGIDSLYDHGFHTDGVLAVDCWGDPAEEWYDEPRCCTDRSVLAVGLGRDPFEDHWPSTRHEFDDSEQWCDYPDDMDTTVDYVALAATFLELEEEPTTPCQCGVDRSRRGTLGWWEIDQKDHRTWMNRRRSTGLSRAPKWQQKAGGRSKARQSIRHLPV